MRMVPVHIGLVPVFKRLRALLLCENTERRCHAHYSPHTLTSYLICIKLDLGLLSPSNHEQQKSVVYTPSSL